MIDRRTFVQFAGGTAAGGLGLVTSTISGTARTGAAASAVALSQTEIGDGVVSPLADPSRLLSDRLAQASGGRLGLAPVFAVGDAGSRSPDRIVLASEEAFAAEEPTSLLLGGYPFGSRASDLEIITWLRGAGGQGLWDTAAARRNWKPLMVGGAGGCEAFVWSRKVLETVDDLAAMRIAAPRTVHEPLRALGAVPLSAVADDPLSALEAGAIDVFEADDPALLLAAAARLGSDAHWYTGSIAGTGRVLSLRVPLAQWQSLSRADQALVEAVAQETATAVLAVRRANIQLLVRQVSEMRGRRPAEFPVAIQEALGREGLRLLPEALREEPVFASMLATMTALVDAPDNFDPRRATA